MKHQRSRGLPRYFQVLAASCIALPALVACTSGSEPNTPAGSTGPTNSTATPPIPSVSATPASPPATNAAEIFRVEYLKSKGRTVLTEARTPRPGTAYLVEASCTSEDAEKQLPYTVTPVGKPTQLLSAGTIPCNKKKIMDTALASNQTSSPVQVNFSDSLEDVLSAYAVLIPA